MTKLIVKMVLVLLLAVGALAFAGGLAADHPQEAIAVGARAVEVAQDTKETVGAGAEAVGNIFGADYESAVEATPVSEPNGDSSGRDWDAELRLNPDIDLGFTWDNRAPVSKAEADRLNAQTAADAKVWEAEATYQEAVLNIQQEYAADMAEAEASAEKQRLAGELQTALAALENEREVNGAEAAAAMAAAHLQEIQLQTQTNGYPTQYKAELAALRSQMRAKNAGIWVGGSIGAVALAAGAIFVWRRLGSKTEELETNALFLPQPRRVGQWIVVQSVFRELCGIPPIMVHESQPGVVQALPAEASDAANIDPQIAIESGRSVAIANAAHQPRVQQVLTSWAQALHRRQDQVVIQSDDEAIGAGNGRQR